MWSFQDPEYNDNPHDIQNIYKNCRIISQQKYNDHNSCQSYCCNISALPGFEWFIHHSEFLKNISYSVVAGYIFYLVQYVISNYILGKKALKLLIPVRGWFAAKEGGSIDLKGQDVVLYETAIKGTLEQEKLYYRKKAAPFNRNRKIESIFSKSSYMR